MKIRFKLAATDLNKALDIVSIVTPKAITPQGGSGYLFVVQGEKCRVYSRNALHVARAELPITDVEGEGAFICPTGIGAFRYFEGEVAFEAEEDEQGNHVIRYRSAGAGAEKASFDPRLIAGCDKEYAEATDERSFPVGILREAITQSRTFLPKPQDAKAEEQLKTIQIFDESKEEWAKGKGHLYATNSVQAFFFYCDAFLGSGLAIHGQHLPFLTTFLTKSTGQVTFKTGKNMTFASDAAGNVLGWTHHSKTHGKFAYYGTKLDQYVLYVVKGDILRSLKYLREEMDSKRDKIRIAWDEGEKRIMFQAQEGSGKVDGFPVLPKTVESTGGKDFTCNVNIDHMIELFDGLKGNIAELRVAVIPPDARRPKGVVMFRTIDSFYLDAEGKVVMGEADKAPEGAFACRVTRVMPQKE